MPRRGRKRKTSRSSAKTSKTKESKSKTNDDSLQDPEPDSLELNSEAEINYLQPKDYQSQILTASINPEENADGYEALYECVKLPITTKEDAAGTSQDPENFPSQVTVRFNHKIDSEAYLEKLNRLRQLKSTFHTYFANGHSPMSAHILHRCDLHSLYGPEFYNVVSNPEICPTYNWCLREYNKFTNSNATNNQITINEAVLSYNDKHLDEHAILLHNNEIMAISAPLMKSIFQTGFGEEVITVRIFSSPNSQKVVLFLCHTPIGTLPIGIIVARTNDVSKICDGIKALVDLFGVSYNPGIIVCDESRLISRCLEKCFPKSKIVFNQSRLLQKAWRLFRSIICADDDGDDEFQILFNLFQVILGSPTKEEFVKNFNGFLVYAEKFPTLSGFVEFFKSRAESYVYYARPQIDISDQVLSYTDSGTIILQDIITKYAQYFNTKQLFDFLVKNYVQHYKRKLEIIVKGGLQGFFKTNFYIPSGRLMDFSCEPISPTEYVVGFENGGFFFVNSDLETCTCQINVRASSCVHQYIVDRHQGLVPECYTPLRADMLEIFKSILDSIENTSNDETVLVEFLDDSADLLLLDNDESLDAFDEINLTPCVSESKDEEFFTDSGQYVVDSDNSSIIEVVDSSVNSEDIDSANIADCAIAPGKGSADFGVIGNSNLLMGSKEPPRELESLNNSKDPEESMGTNFEKYQLENKHIFSDFQIICETLNDTTTTASPVFDFEKALYVESKHSKTSNSDSSEVEYIFSDSEDSDIDSDESPEKIIGANNTDSDNLSVEPENSNVNPENILNEIQNPQAEIINAENLSNEVENSISPPEKVEILNVVGAEIAENLPNAVKNSQSLTDNEIPLGGIATSNITNCANFSNEIDNLESFTDNGILLGQVEILNEVEIANFDNPPEVEIPIPNSEIKAEEVEAANIINSESLQNELGNSKTLSENADFEKPPEGEISNLLPNFEIKSEEVDISNIANSKNLQNEVENSQSLADNELPDAVEISNVEVEIADREIPPEDEIAILLANSEIKAEEGEALNNTQQVVEHVQNLPSNEILQEEVGISNAEVEIGGPLEDEIPIILTNSEVKAEDGEDPNITEDLQQEVESPNDPTDNEIFPEEVAVSNAEIEIANYEIPPEDDILITLTNSEIKAEDVEAPNTENLHKDVEDSESLKDNEIFPQGVEISTSNSTNTGNLQQEIENSKSLADNEILLEEAEISTLNITNSKNLQQEVAISSAEVEIADYQIPPEDSIILTNSEIKAEDDEAPNIENAENLRQEFENAKILPGIEILTSNSGNFQEEVENSKSLTNNETFSQGVVTNSEHLLNEVENSINHSPVVEAAEIIAENVENLNRSNETAPQVFKYLNVTNFEDLAKELSDSSDSENHPTEIADSGYEIIQEEVENALKEVENASIVENLYCEVLAEEHEVSKDIGNSDISPEDCDTSNIKIPQTPLEEFESYNTSNFEILPGVFEYSNSEVLQQPFIISDKTDQLPLPNYPTVPTVTTQYEVKENGILSIVGGNKRDYVQFLEAQPEKSIKETCEKMPHVPPSDVLKPKTSKIKVLSSQIIRPPLNLDMIKSKTLRNVKEFEQVKNNRDKWLKQIDLKTLAQISKRSVEIAEKVDGSLAVTRPRLSVPNRLKPPLTNSSFEVIDLASPNFDYNLPRPILRKPLKIVEAKEETFGDKVKLKYYPQKLKGKKILPVKPTIRIMSNSLTNPKIFKRTRFTKKSQLSDDESIEPQHYSDCESTCSDCHSELEALVSSSEDGEIVQSMTRKDENRAGCLTNDCDVKKCVKPAVEKSFGLDIEAFSRSEKPTFGEPGKVTYTSEWSVSKTINNSDSDVETDVPLCPLKKSKSGLFVGQGEASKIRTKANVHSKNDKSLVNDLTFIFEDSRVENLLAGDKVVYIVDDDKDLSSVGGQEKEVEVEDCANVLIKPMETLDKHQSSNDCKNLVTELNSEVLENLDKTAKTSKDRRPKLMSDSLRTRRLKAKFKNNKLSTASSGKSTNETRTVGKHFGKSGPIDKKSASSIKPIEGNHLKVSVLNIGNYSKSPPNDCEDLEINSTKKRAKKRERPQSCEDCEMDLTINPQKKRKRLSKKPLDEPLATKSILQDLPRTESIEIIIDNIDESEIETTDGENPKKCERFSKISPNEPFEVVTETKAFEILNDDDGALVNELKKCESLPKDCRKIVIVNKIEILSTVENPEKSRIQSKIPHCDPVCFTETDFINSSVEQQKIRQIEPVSTKTFYKAAHSQITEINSPLEKNMKLKTGNLDNSDLGIKSTVERPKKRGRPPTKSQTKHSDSSDSIIKSPKKRRRSFKKKLKEHLGVSDYDSDDAEIKFSIEKLKQSEKLQVEDSVPLETADFNCDDSKMEFITSPSKKSGRLSKIPKKDYTKMLDFNNGDSGSESSIGKLEKYEGSQMEHFSAHSTETVKSEISERLSEKPQKDHLEASDSNRNDSMIKIPKKRGRKPKNPHKQPVLNLNSDNSEIKSTIDDVEELDRPKLEPSSANPVPFNENLEVLDLDNLKINFTIEQPKKSDALPEKPQIERFSAHFTGTVKSEIRENPQKDHSEAPVSDCKDSEMKSMIKLPKKRGRKPRKHKKTVLDLNSDNSEINSTIEDVDGPRLEPADANSVPFIENVLASDFDNFQKNLTIEQLKNCDALPKKPQNESLKTSVTTIPPRRSQRQPRRPKKIFSEDFISDNSKVKSTIDEPKKPELPQLEPCRASNLSEASNIDCKRLEMESLEISIDNNGDSKINPPIEKLEKHESLAPGTPQIQYVSANAVLLPVTVASEIPKLETNLDIEQSEKRELSETGKMELIVFLERNAELEMMCRELKFDF